MALIFILQTLKLQKEVIFWMSWTWLTYIYIELSCCLIRKLQLIYNEFSSWQNVGNANRINLKSKKWFYYLWRFKNSGTIVPFNPSLFGLCIMTVGILYCFTLLLWGLVKLPLGDSSEWILLEWEMDVEWAVGIGAAENWIDIQADTQNKIDTRWIIMTLWFTLEFVLLCNGQTSKDKSSRKTKSLKAKLQTNWDIPKIKINSHYFVRRRKQEEEMRRIKFSSCWCF